MKSNGGYWLRLLLCAALSSLCTVAWAEDEEQEFESPLGNDAEAFQMFPVGKPWTGVRVPKYNEREELVSLMDSKTLTRENEEVLKLNGLTVVMFKGEGELSLRLKTREGLFNVRTGKLRSRSQADIEHTKFVMKGDRMEFDTETQMGKLNGNVVMEIFDAGAAAALILPQQASTEEKASEEKPTSTISQKTGETPEAKENQSS